MERWRLAWRDGIAPALLNPELEALRDALATNDDALIQGLTCACDSWGRVYKACAIGLAAWRGRGLQSEREIESAFSKTAQATKVRLVHAPHEGTWNDFLTWFDMGDTKEVFPQLLAEVELSLAERARPRGEPQA